MALLRRNHLVPIGRFISNISSPFYRVQALPSRHVLRWCVLLLGLVALTPFLLPAQAVVGFGDDATIAPVGVVRVGLTNNWTRFDQRFWAPNSASINTQSQERRTPIFMELGLLSRLSVRVMVPSVGTKVIATYFPDTASAIHADSVRTFNHSAIGDAEASLKLVWLRTLNDRERFHPRGVHVRSAITGLVRLGTGQLQKPTDQFGIGTGDAQTDLEVGSQWDFIFGRHFWTSLTGRYGKQLSDTRVIRVAPREDPFSPVAGPVNAMRQLGDYYQIEATPRLSLGDYFSIGAQYQYYHKAQDSFTGTNDIATDSTPIHLDASSLDAGSDITAQRVGVGVVFSSVAAKAAARTHYAFEVTLQHFRTVDISGNRPKDYETLVGVRFYVPLWKTSGF